MIDNGPRPTPIVMFTPNEPRDYIYMNTLNVPQNSPAISQPMPSIQSYYPRSYAYPSRSYIQPNQVYDQRNYGYSGTNTHGLNQQLYPQTIYRQY